MRSLGFTLTGARHLEPVVGIVLRLRPVHALRLSRGSLPQGSLRPGQADRRAAGLKFVQQRPVEVHPMKEYRRVPLAQLRKRLQIEEYERETPFEALAYRPAAVRIKLKQHAGHPAAAVVGGAKR